jgi:plasmid stability protein
MSVRTTIDIPEELHAELRRRAAAEHSSIRWLITNAIETKLRPQPSRAVAGPLVGKKGKPATGSPDRENPYDVLFA